jgi:hypothetical protein
MLLPAPLEGERKWSAADYMIILQTQQNLIDEFPVVNSLPKNRDSVKMSGKRLRNSKEKRFYFSGESSQHAHNKRKLP